MQTTIQAQVAPQVLQDGNQATLRLGKSGETIVQEVHGRYYEAAYRKGLYTAFVAGGTITTVGTSMTGLILINKSTSVNLSLLKVNAQETVTAASATSIGLAWFNALTTFGGTTLTAVTPMANFLGASLPQAGVYSAVNSTNGTPVEFLTLLHNTAAIATTGEDPGAPLDLEGSYIVPPGYGVCFCAIGASATANAFIQWEEVPV